MFKVRLDLVLEQPGLVERVPAHGSVLEQEDL